MNKKPLHKVNENIVPRTLPFHLESEEALLGSILINPDILDDVSATIQLNDFYSERHKYIYEAFLYLYEKNSPIDVISVAERLSEMQLEDPDYNWTEYLTTLSHIVPSSVNAHHYSSIINKMSTKRRLIKMGEEISRLGYDVDDTTNELLERADKMMYEGILDKQSKDTYEDINNLMTNAFERIKNIHDSKESLRGIQTGIRSLDNRLSGLQPSDLIILAARPGMGKTTFALDIARSAAKQGARVGIFSLEMSSTQLVDRLIASEAHVDAWRLRVGGLRSEGDFESVTNAIDILSNLPIFIDERAGNSIAAIRSSIRRMKRENSIDFVVVDYLQLITAVESRGSDSIVQQITEISRTLKQIARETQIPILALSQLSRNIEHRGGEPRLSDLRDSGSIEQDADVVMFIHKEKGGDSVEKTTDGHPVSIMIEKHRNGPVGRFNIFFNKKIVSFVDIDSQHEAVSLEEE